MLKQNATLLTEYLQTIFTCGALRFDEGRSVELTLENDLQAIIQYAETRQAIVITILIGVVNPNDSRFLYEVLCGNTLWQCIGGSNVGINRKNNILSLHKLVPLPQEPAVFEAVFRALLRTARYWKKHMEENKHLPRLQDVSRSCA